MRTVAHAPRIVWQLFLSTIMVTLITLAVTALIDNYLWPYKRTSGSQLIAHPISNTSFTTIFSTTSEAFAKGKSKIDSAAAQSRSGYIELYKSKKSLRLNVDYLHDTHSFLDASGDPISRSGLPSTETVLAFFHACQLDTADEQVQSEAASAAELMRSAAESEALQFGQAIPKGFDLSSGLFIAPHIERVVPIQTFILTSWLLLWIIGITFNFSRLKRKLSSRDPLHETTDVET